MANIFRTRTITNQTDSLAYYLPSGDVFQAKFVPDTRVRRYLRALAAEIMRFHSILEEVADEHDITITQNLINEWENALGIPLSCFKHIKNKTIEQRRQHLLMILNDLHGSTAQDFVNLAQKLGYDVDIEPATRHGMFPAAFPIYFFDSGKTVKFSVIVHLKADTTPLGFPYSFPIIFQKADNELLRCLFSRMKPANTEIFYIYDKE